MIHFGMIRRRMKSNLNGGCLGLSLEETQPVDDIPRMDEMNVKRSIFCLSMMLRLFIGYGEYGHLFGFAPQSHLTLMLHSEFRRGGNFSLDLP